MASVCGGEAEVNANTLSAESHPDPGEGARAVYFHRAGSRYA
jgi:hypothetical protein